ncbi:hypothetical protein [Streptacidiphilus sp. EB129]|uniref:hypothetical protein n=1 Tax=Streptacidiphilus sp. EB129 TaxID=3156262 RepID=UPI003519506D
MLLQECESFERDGHKLLCQVERDLDMDGILAPSLSGRGPGVLYRRETMGRRVAWKTDDNIRETHHGFGVISFDVGLPTPLSVASVHVTPWGADKAVQEADYMASRIYRLGPYCLLGGDINYAPQDGPDPDFAAMRPYNVGSRTRLHDPAVDRPLEADRRVAWKLAQNGLRDVARELHQQSKDDSLLAATGTDDRIDQLWVSRPLVPGLVSYQLLDTPAGASDHHGLVAVIRTEDIVTADPWEYR